MLPHEREYKFWGAHGTCFAYSIATWCFLTGGIVANYVGAIQGMVCLIAGNLIGTLMVSASLSAGCHRYGLEQIDFCKPAFGQNGARIVLIFYLINMIGWSGLILVMFGNGIVNIVDAMGYHPPQWLAGAGVALGIWITYIITTRGVHLLSMFNNIITPGLIVVVCFMFYMLVTAHGWDEIVAAQPLDPLPDALAELRGGGRTGHRIGHFLVGRDRLPGPQHQDASQRDLPGSDPLRPGERRRVFHCPGLRAGDRFRRPDPVDGAAGRPVHGMYWRWFSSRWRILPRPRCRCSPAGWRCVTCPVCTSVAGN